MARQLIVVAGADKDRAFPLADNDVLVIGTSHMHTEICLHDSKVSRAHCEVQAEGERVVVTDLDSSSGTFVNGTKVTQQEIRPGDIIGVGATQLCLKVGEMPKPAPMKNAMNVSYGMTASPAERLAMLTGSTLGHYEILALIAKGHAGVTYRARDQKGNQTVALKVLSPDFPKGDAEKQRFIESMKKMLALRHPHFVTPLGTGKTGPYCWIALEFVEGESVAGVLTRAGAAGALDWKNALRIGTHVGRALDFAHEAKVVHGNVTPQNILIRASDKTVKLNDVVLSKALEGSQLRQATWQTKMVAELPYQSPEQTRGANQADARSDIYSLGAVVYALLAGRPPFLGKAPQETIKRIRKAEPAPPKEFQASLPDLFERAVLKMLSKEPDERYQKAGEVVADLEKVARNLGVRM